MLRPLLLTQGDPAGIGPELTLKAWLSLRDQGVLFAVVADPACLNATARRLGLDVPLRETDIAGVAVAFPEALPVIPTGYSAPVEAGQPNPASAAGTIVAIERAVAAVQSGAARAVITNPIAKHVLYEAGFRHPGHTEFLAALAAKGDAIPRPVMMIWSEVCAVIPVTIHVPLKDVPNLLTTDLIVETGHIAARDLRERFGIAAPRLAVAGLNPHAGESGTIGREDEEVVRPAVAALRAEGIDAFGPLPADTLFHARARTSYDVALAMYHDQGLAPIKALAFDEAVNVTLGLPFVRTSPDHGTAFDIAGRGIARPDSLIAAIRLADRLSRQNGPVA